MRDALTVPMGTGERARRGVRISGWLACVILLTACGGSGGSGAMSGNTPPPGSSGGSSGSGASGGGASGSGPSLTPPPNPASGIFTESIYSELVPPTSGLAYSAATDTAESFVAPNGQTVQVLVKGPVGVTPGMTCPSASCYVMRPINPGETPDNYFPAAVQAAQAANASKLVIPQGTYNFAGPQVDTDVNNPQTCNENNYSNCNPHWTIGSYPGSVISSPTGLSDLDIDLSGSVLNFPAPGTGIWIVNTQRVRLENFTLDYPNLKIASLGTIVADPNDPGHHALVIDDAYPVADPFAGGAPVQIQAVDVWDAGTGAANPQGDFDLSAGNSNETYFIFGNAPQPTYVGKTAAGNQTFSCSSCNFVNSATDSSCSFFSGCANFDLFPVGTRVLVRHYTYNGFAILVDLTSDLDIENAALLTSPGVGIGTGSLGGFRGLRFASSSITRGSGRLISTASDAINISDSDGDVMIESDEIAFEGDDGININTTFHAIAAVTMGSMSIVSTCSGDAQQDPVVNDVLAFFDPNLNYLGAASVSGVTGSGCPGTAQIALQCANSTACQSMLLALSATDEYIDLTQKAGGRYIVSNNNFHESRGHAVTANAPYGSITNNMSYRESSGAFALSAGGGGGPGATNLIISGNKVSWTGLDARDDGAIAMLAQPAQGLAPATTFDKLLINNNSFSNTEGPALVVAAAGDVQVQGNLFSNLDLVTNAPGSTTPVSGGYGNTSNQNSVRVYDARNVSICGTQSSGSTTGIVGVDAATTTQVTQAAVCP